MEHINYGDIDLNLLIVLDRLLDRRSVTLAARDLGLSQPATSRALTRLREALGDPLLQRNGRNMVPTERALGLVQPVSRAIEAANRVFAPPIAFDASTAKGTIVLGLGDEGQQCFVRPIYQRMSELAPHIDLRIRAVGPDSVKEGHRGLLDVALAPDLSALPEGTLNLDAFVTRRLYRRRFAVVASRRAWPHPPDLATYLSAKHVLMSFEGGGQGFVDHLLAARGLSRRVVASVTSFSAVVQLVAETDLLAVVPTEVVPTDHVDVVLHAAPIPLPELPILMLWHPRTTTNARHRFFRKLLNEVVLDVIGPQDC